MPRRHSHWRTTPQPGVPANPLFDLPTWRPDRKALQLAKQVYEALSWVFASVVHDDQLVACTVDAVEPLPGGNRLLVKIGVPPDLPASDVTVRLAAVAPALRAEVAQSITRRKVPELVYLAIPAKC
jgi:ribosome-binding factor A